MVDSKFEKKKVLIVFSHNRLTGVTTFNYTLSKMLSRKDFEIHVHVVFRETKMSLVEDKLKESYPITFGNKWPLVAFDYVFFSDHKSLHLGHQISGKKFFIAHGLGELAQELRPIDVPLVSHLFSLSPFMNIHYSQKYSKLSQSYLPNFIDTAVYRTDKKLNSFPKMALLNDRRRGKDYIAHLAPIFKKMKIELIPVYDLNFGYPIWEMQKIYSSFDLVLGYGRSIYEAMSCGRNVIVFGSNWSDGYLNKENFAPSFFKNASGWGLQKFKIGDSDFSQKLEREIGQYSDSNSESLREIVVENLGVDKNVNLLFDSF